MELCCWPDRSRLASSDIFEDMIVFHALMLLES